MPKPVPAIPSRSRAVRPLAAACIAAAGCCVPVGCGSLTARENFQLARSVHLAPTPDRGMRVSRSPGTSLEGVSSRELVRAELSPGRVSGSPGRAIAEGRRR